MENIKWNDSISNASVQRQLYIRMKVSLGLEDLWEIIDKDYMELENKRSLSQTQNNSLQSTKKKDGKAIMSSINAWMMACYKELLMQLFPRKLWRFFKLLSRS
jgi:hypothetical protein